MKTQGKFDKGIKNAHFDIQMRRVSFRMQGLNNQRL